MIAKRMASLQLSIAKFLARARSRSEISGGMVRIESLSSKASIVQVQCFVGVLFSTYSQVNIIYPARLITRLL